jgi:hypothetical protein
MQKRAFAVIAFLVASFLTPATASASGAAPVPPSPGHQAGARSPHPAGPIARRSPATVITSPVCDGTYNVIASPNRTGNNLLESNTAVSVNDVWAVGISNDNATTSQTLAEHWNGTSWSILPTVNPGTRHNRLFSVSAVASNNVWAVGDYDINAANLFNSATLAEHWNGTSWTKVTTKNPTSIPGFSADDLYGVTAIDASHVYAVGQSFNFDANSGNGAFNTLIEFYNGTSWSVVPSANSSPDDYNELDTISAFSSTDIWAVGAHAPVIDPIAGTLGTFAPLAEHWDGGSWTVVATPFVGAGDNWILGVNALEANHAVGVGYGTTATQVAETWDLISGGGSSSTVRSASAGDNGFQSVARSSNGVWAVGFSSINNTSPLQNMAWQANWDVGTHTLTWAGSPGTTASPSSVFNVLVGVTAVSPSVFWAAGIEDTNTGVDQTLTEVYCGLVLDLLAPATAFAGVPFSLTVTAENPDTSTATGYTGTVHFTSSDAGAGLPTDYTFTPVDAGVHVFNPVVLNNPYNQPSTIKVSDVATPFVSDTASITVTCAGACQSSAGTPGGRGSSTSPAGTSGSRGAGQSPANPPAPRLPAKAPRALNTAARAGSTAATVKPAAVLRILTHAPVRTFNRSGPAPAAAASSYATSVAAPIAPGEPAPDRTPWYLLLVAPLMFTGFLLIARLRRTSS